jgi:hypothetical protein
MYDSNASFTLGFLFCGLILTTVIFFVEFENEADYIYIECEKNGRYVYER